MNTMSAHHNSGQLNDVINFPFIDYIIKSYVPIIQQDERSYKKIKMSIFRQSMIHSSSVEFESDPTYERLEYLGDAIFHVVITEYLYKRYDEENIGFLTKLRIKIERGESMAKLSAILELDRYVQYRYIKLNDHIMEDIFEAFVGAFYLNFGFVHVKAFIIELLERHMDFAVLIAYNDNYKDILLQYFHKMKWGFPKYALSGARSRSNSKTGRNSFDQSEKKKYVSIVRNPFGKILGEGSSSSKKKAEQLASKHALVKLGVIVSGVGDNIDPDWIKKIESMLELTDDVVDPKKKKKTDDESESKVSVYNPNNQLMKKEDIKHILRTYNVPYPKNIKISYKIFYEAMTHKSYLRRKNLTAKDKKCAVGCVPLQSNSNDRLQFLGDSVIHFIIGEFLYSKYKAQDEGFMTRLRCKLENRDSLFYLAKQIGIDDYVLLSQNIDVLYGNRKNVNIVGGGLEAFVGAVYLEIGLNTTREFFLEVVRTELDIDEIADSETNYKEIISQIYVKNRWGYPVYRILKEDGPDHAKIFTMGLYYDNKLITKGTANSKKKAEQIASKRMYEQLQAQGK